MPFSGDFDGDGVADVAVYRPGTQHAHWRPTLTSGPGELLARLGKGELPLAADLDGAFDCAARCDGEPVRVDEVLPYHPEYDGVLVAGLFGYEAADSTAQRLAGTWSGTLRPLYPLPPGVPSEFPITMTFFADGGYVAPNPDIPWASLLGDLGRVQTYTVVDHDHAVLRSAAPDFVDLGMLWGVGFPGPDTLVAEFVPNDAGPWALSLSRS